jgi:hypothetical protein
MNKYQKIENILKYVKASIRKGNYPRGNDIHKKFGIYYLGLTMKDIYKILNVDLLQIPKKPSGTKHEIKKLLIKYIRDETKKKHYPSRREIENQFKLNIDTMFVGIEDLYNAAGVVYRRVENQEIKYQKAQTFLKLILKMLKRNKFRIVSVKKPNQQGIDLIIGISKKRKIGIELKAYNQFERIKIKDIKQLERFNKTNYFKEIWLLTTSSRIPRKIPKWLTILKFEDLKKWCNKEELKILREIRKKSIHQETTDRLRKKQIILNYVKSNAEKGKYMGFKDILRDTHLCIYSYFKSMDDVYNQDGIKVSLFRSRYFKDKNIKERAQQKLLEEILSFIREEVKKGHYPSGVDIGKVFGVKHIWNYWKVNDLYKMLNLPTYLERKTSFSP